MDRPQPYRNALADLAQAVNDPRYSGSLVTANELQFRGYSDLKFFATDIRQRCELAQEPAQPEMMGCLIEALHVLSDRDIGALRLLGFLSAELKLLRVPDPDALVAWQVEFFTRTGAGERWHGLDVASYFAQKPRARSSLEGWVTDALTLGSVEALAERHGLSRTRNEASPPFSACDAVAEHLQFYGGDGDFEKVRRRYLRARKWAQASVHWWDQNDPTALVQGYLAEAAMPEEPIPF